MSVKKYRKKPVEVEAWQHDCRHGVIGVHELADWCGGKAEFMGRQPLGLNAWVIRIPTLEGTMTAMPNDYIIRGVQGEFYPCKPDIFEATYEEAK